MAGGPKHLQENGLQGIGFCSHGKVGMVRGPRHGSGWLLVLGAAEGARVRGG